MLAASRLVRNCFTRRFWETRPISTFHNAESKVITPLVLEDNLSTFFARGQADKNLKETRWRPRYIYTCISRVIHVHEYCITFSHGKNL